MDAFSFPLSGNQLEVQQREQLLQTTRRLLTEVQALSSRIAAVNEIANAINRCLRLDEIWQLVSKRAKWLLDFKHCSVCLQNNDGSCRLVTLFGSPIPSNICPLSGDNPISRALRTGQSQFNPQDYNTTFLDSYPFQIIIPLQIENRIIGSLNFAKSSAPMYNQDDLRIAYLLAVQLASSIRNAQCFEEIDKLLREMNLLYSELELERRKSDKLLLNIMPEQIADELKDTGKVKPVDYESTSVLFADFEGFTKFAEQMTPQALVDELDYCFSYFDLVSEVYNLEKLKTIGDSYMCVGGIPIPTRTHAIDAVLAALQMQAFIGWRKVEKAQKDQPYWDIRIGIHSGPLLAGVIGRKKFTYDVWGDTVNTASRMESSGVPGALNISQATYELIKDFFDCQYRGKIAAKNKGYIDMYLVQRLKKEFSSDDFGLVPNDKFQRIYTAL